MTLKLYGFPLGFTKLPAFILHEKNIPFELVQLNGQEKEHKSSAYLTKQPFGQAPYLDDHGFIIYESRAICRYIAKKYHDQGTPLLPPEGDLKAYAAFEQSAAVEVANILPPIMGIVFAYIIPKTRGGEVDEKEFEKHQATLVDKLKVLDQILAKQNYMTGNHVTIIDFFYVLGWEALEIIPGLTDSPERPNLTRWWTEMKARPSVVALKDAVVGIKA